MVIIASNLRLDSITNFSIRVFMGWVWFKSLHNIIKSLWFGLGRIYLFFAEFEPSQSYQKYVDLGSDN